MTVKYSEICVKFRGNFKSRKIFIKPEHILKKCKYEKNLGNILEKLETYLENVWEKILKKYEKVFEEVRSKFRVTSKEYTRDMP